MVSFAYVGNFEPEHSTENEVRKAILAAGHTVDLYQENTPQIFLDLAGQVEEYDVVLWTRTGWNPPVPFEEQYEMLSRARQASVPTVGFHLDRWFGLRRQGQVRDQPFFRCDFVFTADGGHQKQFAAHGVNHFWLPPAVSEFECAPGTLRPELESDLAFVGSWQRGYHPEWSHRPRLIRWLKSTYGPQIEFWPKKNQPAVRLEKLRDLYASTKVNVGDSCLAGRATHYWSDRIPETLGRGGFLLHPHVEGIEEHFNVGEHLVTWKIGHWPELKALIAYYLDDPEGAQKRVEIASAGRQHVLDKHTYTVRIVQILDQIGR